MRRTMIHWLGLTGILALTAIAFLTYLSAETIFIIRKILNPSKLLQKIPFKITNNDPNEPLDSYEKQMESDNEPTVFDDPTKQEVIFTPEGKAQINDPGYDDGSNKKVPTKVDTPKKLDVDFAVEEVKGDEAADKKTVAPSLEDLEPYDPKRDL